MPTGVSFFCKFLPVAKHAFALACARGARESAARRHLAVAPPAIAATSFPNCRSLASGTSPRRASQRTSACRQPRKEIGLRTIGIDWPGWLALA